MIIVDPENNTVDKAAGRVTLKLLVQRYPPYRNAPGLWPDFAETLKAAVDLVIANPTDEEALATVAALNAVLAQLLQLPTFVADSEGSDDEKVYVSIAGNWAELAQTTLDVLYPPVPEAFSSVVFGAATRGLPPGTYGGEQWSYRWLDERYRL